MPSVMSDIEKQVRARAAELAPIAEEYAQLQRMIEMFEEARDPAAAKPAAARRGRGGRTRGRAKGVGGSGKRAEQALALVKAKPGITVAELADEMGIGPTYLYRVMPALERDGKVKKAGTGYTLA